MTLAGRFSTFFLTVLAIVLIALCVGVVTATYVYLQRQTQHALLGGLNTLVAAVEVVPEGVEWEPAERNLVFAPGPLGQEVSWLLVDESGRQIDGAFRGPSREQLQAAAKENALSASQSAPRVFEHDAERFAQQWLTPQRLHPELPYHPDNDQKHRALGVTVAIATAPIRTAVRLVALALFGTSALLWVIVFVLNRRIGQRVLAPIRHLAKLAAGVDATRLSQRLEVARTSDELESLGCAFNDLLDRLQESFDRQSRFTGDAAHQLRTPLTAILGQVEVAMRRERSPLEYQVLLERVHQQATRLHDIVESLLFLARADGDAWLRQLKPLELSAWLSEYLAQWQQEHSADETVADVELHTEITEHEVWAAAQGVLLGEVLKLLLDNAVKYRAPGTPIRVSLTAVSLAMGNNTARLVVENQAPQLAQHELDSLFEPFRRGADARARGVNGMGLGLTIARRLCETLGGQIGVELQGGRICFRVELPTLAVPTSRPQPVAQREGWPR